MLWERGLVSSAREDGASIDMRPANALNLDAMRDRVTPLAGVARLCGRMVGVMFTEAAAMGIGSIGGFELVLAVIIYFGVPLLIIAGATLIIVRVARAARGGAAHERELAALRERVARLEIEPEAAKR